MQVQRRARRHCCHCCYHCRKLCHDPRWNALLSEQRRAQRSEQIESPVPEILPSTREAVAAAAAAAVAVPLRSGAFAASSLGYLPMKRPLRHRHSTQMKVMTEQSSLGNGW